MTTTPTSGNTHPNGHPKYMPPPAARSGEKGLRVGEGAANGEPLTIERKK